MKKNLLALLLFLIFSNFSFSQNNSVGIGTLTPDKSAILEIYSSNKGLLIPRLTSTDVAALNNPVNGLLVYNKTVNCFWYYQSNAWKSLCDKRFDSIFATYANIKTLVSSHASFDTLQVGGVDIHNLITNIGDSSYWRLKGNILTDSTKNYLGTNDQRPLIIKTNGAERIRISTGGNVGFNTALPTEMIDVAGKIRLRTGATLNYVLTSSATGVGTWTNPNSLIGNTINTLNDSISKKWDIRGNAGTKAGLNYLGTSDVQDLVFKTNAIERVRILTTGIVDVTNKIKLRAGAMKNYVLTSDSAGVGTWTNPNSLIGNTINTLNDSIAKKWDIRGNKGTLAGINYLGTSDAQDLVFKTNATEQVRILTTGIVDVANKIKLRSGAMKNYVLTSDAAGLGTWTNPNTLIDTTVNALNDSIRKKWDIRGNAGTIAGTNYLGTSDAVDLVVKTAGAEHMRMLASNGNVGIGTKTPDFPLTIRQNAAGLTTYALLIQNGIPGNPPNTEVVFRLSPSASAFSRGADISAINNGNNKIDLRFLVSNGTPPVEAMRIQFDGKVGIGTNIPQQPLSVVGGAVIDQTDLNTGTYANVLSFGNGSGEGIASKRSGTGNLHGLDFYTNTLNRMSIVNTGDVGIGTITPRGQFDAAGTGDIYLVNSPITGTGQNLFLPGHIYIAPYNGTNVSYLQARRSDNSGSTNLQLRTWNAGGVTNVMYLQNDGKVGIGTSTPLTVLHILSTTSPATLTLQNTVGGGGSICNIDFQTYATVGGILQPSARIQCIDNAFSSGHLVFSTKISGADANPMTERVRITSNGNVGIGTATPTHLLELGTDDAAKPGSNTWIIASDRRLKKEIRSFTDGLETLKKIKPVWFQYNGKAHLPNDGKNYVGIIAQEIQGIAPYMINTFTDKDTNAEYLNYDGNAMVYLLINSVKEQQVIIEELKKQNIEMQKQIDGLKR